MFSDTTIGGTEIFMCKKPRRLSNPRGDGFIFVPCGKCEECDKQKSLQWTYRIILESKNYSKEDISFITLTYNNEHNDGRLHKKHFQKFIKRVRKHLYPKKVRYIGVGEYGARGKRPHYHLLLFGHNFAKQLFYVKDGIKYYRSFELEKLWTSGYSLLTEYDDATAIYLTKYMQKSLIKYLNKNHIPKESYPFMLQSRKPAIGYRYIENLTFDDIKDDKIYINGHYIKYPRIFLDKLAERGVDLEPLKNARINRCVIEDLDELIFYEKKYKID